MVKSELLCEVFQFTAANLNVSIEKPWTHAKLDETKGQFVPGKMS
jgi:hypothetical protein